MNEMVERVARALFEPDAALDFERAEPEDREYWLAKARIAITAILKPTEGMLGAGGIACGERRNWLLPDVVGSALVWRAMVEAALT
jgi:hypothetical protein